MATRYVDVDAAVGGDGTTNSLSGATCAYKSLNIWEAARQGTLSEVETVVCGSNHASHTADTTACIIAAWVTSAANYIDITTDAGSAASTSWSDAKYRLTVTNGTAIFVDGAYHVRLSGLQMSAAATASTALGYNNASQGAGADHRISKCFIRASGTAAATCLRSSDASAIVAVWNCILHNTGSNSGSACVNVTQGSVTCHHVTGISGQYGFYRGGGTAVAKNCYSAGLSTRAYSGTWTKTTCASSDSTGSTGLTSIAADADTFVSVTGGSEDWALCADSPLIGVGTDVSGDGTVGGAASATDILGTTRS